MNQATHLFSVVVSSVRTWLHHRQERAELSALAYRDLKDLGFPTLPVMRAMHRDATPSSASFVARRAAGVGCPDKDPVARGQAR